MKPKSSPIINVIAPVILGLGIVAVIIVKLTGRILRVKNSHPIKKEDSK